MLGVLAATAIVESIRTHAAAARRPELAREWKRIAPRYQNSDARPVTATQPRAARCVLQQA
jgi:hypothetical protein